MKNSLMVLNLLIFLVLSLSCKKDDPASSLKDILTFTLDEQTEPGVINTGSHSIVIEVESGTDLEHLTPEITISEGAEIYPASGIEVDFSSGSVTYTVTAEDNSTQEWQVYVYVENSSLAEILAFSLPQQTGNATIGVNTIEIEVASGTNLDSLCPVIVVTNGATISPASGEITDFSSGTVTYTVTSAAGPQKIWTVSVTVALNSGNDIVLFDMTGRVGDNTKNIRTLTVTVSPGTDLSSVQPVITVSQGATISPASLQAVDFTGGYVNYTVTSENSVAALWKVVVQYSLTEADNANYQYTGRIDFSDLKRPRFWASAAYIVTKFTGTLCDVEYLDERKWGNKNYLEIVIDGTYKRISSTGYRSVIRVAEGLSDTEHTLMICKDTEANIGYLDFLGIRAKSVTAPDAKPVRKMEFIGNSVTCGSKMDNSEFACDAGNWYDKDRAYLSYGVVTARALNAQWHITSASGIGLIHSCCDMTTVMPQVWNKFNVSDVAGSDWDFTRYIPDVITVCLGQNDGVQDSTAFCSAYVNYIQDIRSRYPDAQIVCLTSPMGDATLNNALKEYITSVVAYMNVTEGDTNVSYFFFADSYNNGCESHPGVADHQDIADELTAYIETLMDGKW